MQVVILCGGKGIRLWPDSVTVPKPLIRIGGAPVLEHIMRYFAHYGHTDFVLCLGYKGEKIREAFQNGLPWNIGFVDTGEGSNKGERVWRVRDRIHGPDFFLAYGDDLSDVDLAKLLAFHRSHQGLATLTTVNPTCQFGIIETQGNQVSRFVEKPRLNRWINGGFFVLSRRIFDHMTPGEDLEGVLLPRLAGQGLVYAYKHEGFWACMNTHQDTRLLNELWEKGEAEWAKWNHD